MLTRVKTASEIKYMRESGRMLATVLKYLEEQLTAGMSTKDVAVLADRQLKHLGGKPAFLGYQGFPDVICISVNEEIVHGIPRVSKILQTGDIVSLDFGVVYGGMVTDAAISSIIGTGSAEDRDLVETTRLSLEAGIDVMKAGVRVGDIGAAVGRVLAEHDYGIVRDLVGHGVGHHLHEEPNIANYGRKGTGMQLQAGMTVAVEPMATLGTYEVYMADDGWTIVSADHSRSAHFEHTILLSDSGAEVLTQI